MSPNTSILAEPIGEDPISQRTLGYVSEGARDDMFDLVLRNCVESGISKATLARRLGKDPAQVSRLLGAPGNWTIDTVAELLFAIDGRILKVDSCWPMREPISNQRYSQWIDGASKTRNLDLSHIMVTGALVNCTVQITTQSATKVSLYNASPEPEYEDS